MKTFKQLLIKELTNLGYPIDNGKLKNLTHAYKTGIEIKREAYPEYVNKVCSRHYEDIDIRLNKYITEQEINKIIDQLKQNYYNKNLLNIYIYE